MDKPNREKDIFAIKLEFDEKPSIGFINYV